MKYRKLGSTGVDVSRICLGCMSYGVPERGGHPWSLDEDASRPFFQRAVELGINFFDTANVYSDGTSEEITGRMLREYANRDEIVLATNADGLDVMTVRVEHQAGDDIAATVAEEIRSRCEVRSAVEVLAPGTLPRTEFKAARVKDRRGKS